ncbi:helix-turn-helix domain-containing protein [bacterium]|nr:helix-turn-helix domain-containing protein [bacterium]
MTYKELGKLLRKARLAKKWRFRDLEQRTKISVTFIKAMENGDFDFLPKPYVKAFIRAYATEVELDVQEVIKHFEASHPETQSPSAATRKKQKTIEAKR